MNVAPLMNNPANLNHLFSQAPIAMAFMSKEEMIIEAANGPMLELWGKSAEVIGLPLLDAIPELKDQPFPKLLKNVYDSGKDYRGYETEALLVRNGKKETCYFNFIYSPIKDATGVVTGISAIAHEVTENVKAKKALQVSENRFRDLIVEADVATAVYVGKDLNIEIANDTMLKVWGKEASVIGKPLSEALPELKNQPFLDILQQVYTTGITYKATEDKVNLVVDGVLQTFYFNFSYKALYNADGEIYGILNMAIDVTEQQLAKKKAEDSERKFRDLMMQAPVAMSVISRENLRIETANGKCLEIWGRSPDVVGKKVMEVFPEIASQGLLEIVDNVFQTGEPFYGNEMPIRLNYGYELRTLYINFVYHPIYENERITALMSLGYDVSDLVLSRKKAEENELKFRNLVLQAPVPTAVLRGENMVLDLVNEAMLQLWGRDKSILNRELLQFLPELKGQGYPELLAEVFRTGIAYTNTESRADFIIDGAVKTYYFNFTYKPLSEGDINTGILIMAVDVTDLVLSRKRIEESEAALRKSEKRFKDLADSMPQMVWTARPDGYLDYYNKQWYDFTGFDPHTFGDESWAPVLHEEDLPKVIEAWGDCVRTGKTYQIEYRFKNPTKKAGYSWFLGRAVPIRDENGEITHWIGTNTDIDDFKVLQRQKDDFLGIASHELKTPVTSLKAYAQVLEAILLKEGDKKKASFVHKMDVQINKLTSLIGDLLDVTKIQTGRMQFRDAHFDFEKLVDEIIEDLSHSTNQSHIIVKNFEPTGVVYADRERIGQVITNLITNAVKYSPNAKKIIVYTRRENDDVRLCVQDFGIGIPNDKKDRVFEQFYRVSGTKEHTFPGLGLGLYISSEIIKRVGGEIWVNSAVGEGSTFCFSLPINKE